MSTGQLAAFAALVVIYCTTTLAVAFVLALNNRKG